MLQPARYKAFHGGRGGAKSHSFATAALVLAGERPLRVGCFREIQKSIAISVKQLLEDKIDEMGLRGFYTSTQTEIRATNGTKFIFSGLRSNPEAIKSMEGLDIAWVEEADRCSQSSLDLLIPTVRRPNSEIWFSWNRRKVTDPVDAMFLGGEPPPGCILKKVGWQDNPWFPDVLRDEMLWMKGRDYEKYMHVWGGEPVGRLDSKVFRNWRVDDIDDRVPSGCVPRYGADWGFSVDPTVLVQCFVWDRTLYFRREAFKVRCEIDETPSLFAGTDQRVPRMWENRHHHPGVAGAFYGKIVADSARPETISYMAKRGFNIRRAIKGPRSVEEGIEFMNSYDIVVHPECRHVEEELATHSYKVDQLTDEVLAELEDKDNHVIDAARYALESLRRAGHRRIGGQAPPGLLGPRVVEA